MKKRAIIGVTGLAVLLAALYLWGPSSVPAGQERLTLLTNANYGEFGAAFDRDADVPLLLLLLSPT